MPVHLTCPVCGVAFTRAPSDVKGGMCSVACRYAKPPLAIESRDGAFIALVPLRSQGGSVRAYAIIDAADAEWVNQWRWVLNSRGYAERHSRHGTIALHREILGLTPGDEMEGDHINRNRLDNRRTNLRAVPKAGNRHNVPGNGGSSQFRGVSWDRRLGKWVASVKADGKRHHLGVFSDEIEAAEAAKAGRSRYLPYAVD
jgi:hypothetical protein